MARWLALALVVALVVIGADVAFRQYTLRGPDHGGLSTYTQSAEPARSTEVRDDTGRQSRAAMGALTAPQRGADGQFAIRFVGTASAADGYEWEWLICSYDWPCGEALGVVYGNGRCPNGESTGNPLAFNAGHYGLYQVAAYDALRFGYTPTDLWQADINVYVAYQLWLDSGWRPWYACHP